ncbi:unnamed protein product [Wuchereria bancrofti]|uniref:Uncharacterized protein n=1 Tax=Wuchereria bancrofti TaxID=6293 RepID=A0A3P7E0U6_WUCBA|nr:unnamed protein product [Wuchereria bancrofti]
MTAVTTFENDNFCGAHGQLFGWLKELLQPDSHEYHKDRIEWEKNKKINICILLQINREYFWNTFAPDNTDVHLESRRFFIYVAMKNSVFTLRAVQ